MTPADTPESIASMKRRRVSSSVFVVTSSSRWDFSSRVMVLKVAESRRRSPSPRRSGSSTIRLPVDTSCAAPMRRRTGATKRPANHMPAQIAASTLVSEIMK